MFYVLAIMSFVVGLVVGGLCVRQSRRQKLLMSRSQVRSERAAGNEVSAGKGDSSVFSQELAGVLAALSIPYGSGLIPRVVMQTEKTVVFRHPRPRHAKHYVFVPKKDIKNIGELTEADREYLQDIFAAVVTVVASEGLTDYRLWTNGPDKQDVAYLHFHLGAD